MNKKKIVIIGLGYVGLPLAVEFGKIRKVIGFDVDTSRINELNKGIDRTLEITTEELSSVKYIKFISDINKINKEINSEEEIIFIITVPTPINNANRPNLLPLIKASEMVGRILRKKDIVVYESTVYPGATEEVCVPALESSSGLSFKNGDFYVGYSPERINPGDKTHKLVDIVKITSGCNAKIAKEVDTLYAEIIVAGTHLVSTIKVAEAAKVIENTQRDLNIAFVNELSIIFDKLNIDTNEVLEAAETKWNFLKFKPGLVGGHCIGVDPYYLTHKAEEIGYIPQVILAGRRINDEMPYYAAKKIIKKMIRNNIDISKSKIGVMGITFKENCPDVRNSKVVNLIKELEEWGAEISVTDPLADIFRVQQEYNIKITKFKKIEEFDAIIVAVSHDEFKKINPNILKSYCNKQLKPIIADLKGIYNIDSLEAHGFTVFRL